MPHRSPGAPGRSASQYLSGKPIKYYRPQGGADIRHLIDNGFQAFNAGRLSEASTGGYVAFWWIVAIFLLALPFLVGWGVANLSGKTLGIITAIVAVFFIAILIMGQLFIF